MPTRHLIVLAAAATLAAATTPAQAGTERPPGGSIACARADNMYCRLPYRSGASTGRDKTGRLHQRA